MSDKLAKNRSAPSLNEPSQSWNWVGVSQKISDSCAGNYDRSTSAHSAAPSNDKPDQPLLHPRQQIHPKPKTISTTTERLKPATIDTETMEEFSALRITERTISAKALRSEMKGRKFIKLQHMDRVSKEIFTDKKVDWVTIGVLVRKTLSKPAANGSTFMVWGLSDLDGTELAIFLFGDAYSTHWKESPGAIVAILNATLLPSSETNQFAFKSTQPTEIVTLGKATDFGICKGITSRETRCRLAINTAKTQYCLHHIAVNFMEAGKGRQQLNNFTGSLRKSLFAGSFKNLSTGVYTSASSTSNTSKWKSINLNKRKRNDASTGVLSLPTVLTASGAVVQRSGKQFNRCTAQTKALSDKQRASLSLMDQLRQPPAAMNSKRIQSNEGSTTVTLPSSRAQKIVSAILTGDGKLLKRRRIKKVNMMQFMNAGAQTKK